VNGGAGEKHVFVFNGGKNQVAVFALVTVVFIFGVYGVGAEKIKQWNLFEKFPELNEKGPGKVILFTVIKRTPLVRPPELGIHRLKILRGVKNRKQVFGVSRRPAASLIKRAFVPPRHSADHPAFRAPGRRRDIYFFVEIKVIRFNPELLMTVLAFP